eukprot:scaffold5294_cov72-Cyclotella_meneghiniana.AAC.3
MLCKDERQHYYDSDALAKISRLSSRSSKYLTVDATTGQDFLLPLSVIISTVSVVRLWTLDLGFGIWAFGGTALFSKVDKILWGLVLRPGRALRLRPPKKLTT